MCLDNDDKEHLTQLNYTDIVEEWKTLKNN